MKLFECQNCGQLLHFENTRCENCGFRLGYLRQRETITAVRPAGATWRALAEPRTRYRFCANAEHGVCNWLMRAEYPSPYCAACRHNRTIPDLTVPENLARWRKVEIAKHRLFYTLLKLRLPLAARSEDPDGLAFDFLASDERAPHGSAPVMTGHDNGLITINLAEADDAERERVRSQMGEPYRTLLGHFRHEIAHYYWDRLVANSRHLDEFRRVFGDEREDYAAALQRHYANGPPPNWSENFVTAYAASHPWEDFAETWAHYLHIVDTLESAHAFGLRVRPKVSKGAELSTTIDFDPHHAPMDRIVDAWMPLTVAMNSINRSMGQPDLYPFVLSPAVVVKLAFIHDRIHTRDWEKRATAKPRLRSMVENFKRKMGAENAS
jgi:hypothetical protein